MSGFSLKRKNITVKTDEVRSIKPGEKITCCKVYQFRYTLHHYPHVFIPETSKKIVDVTQVIRHKKKHKRFVCNEIEKWFAGRHSNLFSSSFDNVSLGNPLLKVR